MKLTVKFLASVSLLLCAIATQMAGQTVNAASEVRTLQGRAAAYRLEDRLRDDVTFLSDTLLAGRATGTGGAQLAAQYIYDRFVCDGFRTYVQCFDAMGKAGHNVVGEYCGDPSSSRWTVIFAYYDGYGRTGGKMHPGADSNASGVAALLALADSFSGRGFADWPAEGLCPSSYPARCRTDSSPIRRNIIFVALDGHAANLSGAYALRDGLRHKVVLAVNLDTVGSTLAPPLKGHRDYLIALGGARYRQQMESANSAVRLRLSYDYYDSRNFTDLFYRKVSDQRPFLEKGVPSVMFTSGITMNTNKETDNPASLDYVIFARRVEFIRTWFGLLQ